MHRGFLVILEHTVLDQFRVDAPVEGVVDLLRHESYSVGLTGVPVLPASSVRVTGSLSGIGVALEGGALSANAVNASRLAIRVELIKQGLQTMEPKQG
jgi:hypothetical protein